MHEADMKSETDQRDFVNNILFDVYSDFEKTLEHATIYNDRSFEDSKFPVFQRIGLINRTNCTNISIASRKNTEALGIKKNGIVSY